MMDNILGIIRDEAKLSMSKQVVDRFVLAGVLLLLRTSRISEEGINKLLDYVALDIKSQSGIDADDLAEYEEMLREVLAELRPALLRGVGFDQMFTHRD